jgi:tRNA(fMet)-specific endonuclease VapC
LCDRLIIEPVRKGRLLALLASLEPLEEPFPDVDGDLAPLDDVEPQSMSLRYLLDTSIISELARRPGGIVATRITDVGEDSICTSIVAAAELRYGAAKPDSKQLSKPVGLLLSALEILPLEPPADRRNAEVRHHLTTQGTPIRPNELSIAAHALAADLTLVTANTREFERVPSLRVENWLLAYTNGSAWDPLRPQGWSTGVIRPASPRPGGRALRPLHSSP